MKAEITHLFFHIFHKCHLPRNYKRNRLLRQQAMHLPAFEKCAYINFAVERAMSIRFTAAIWHRMRKMSGNICYFFVHNIILFIKPTKIDRKKYRQIDNTTVANESDKFFSFPNLIKTIHSIFRCVYKCNS